MNIGHFDSLDESWTLSGWFIDDELDAVPEVFAVLQGDAVLAVGRRHVERPDVQAQYGQLICGFHVRLLPTVPLVTNVPLTLTVAGSQITIKTNKFFPSDEVVSDARNSSTSVLSNANLVSALTKNWLFSNRYLADFHLEGFSPELTATFYLCMKEYWSHSPCEWINIQHVSAQLGGTSFSEASPLELLNRPENQSLSPNCLFDIPYISGRLASQDESATKAPAAILRRWLDALEEGSLVRPSAIVRGRFDPAGRFAGSRKARGDFVVALKALISNSADFSTLSGLIPVFDIEWLKTRPIKASENGATILQKILQGLSGIAPNPFFSAEAGLSAYRNCCERMDAGEVVDMSAINPSLSSSVMPFVNAGNLNVDSLAAQLRSKAEWRHDRPSVAFIEQVFPGISDFLAKKTGAKNANLAYRIYLEQLGIPQSIATVDLSQTPPGFSPERFRRLGFLSVGCAVKASIIIPTLGRIDLLFNLLVSLANSSISTPTEIIVSDDGSSLDVSILSFFFPNVKFMASPLNRGFLRNVNEAAALARGEYIVIANNDLLVHRQALDELVRTLDAHPTAGVVGGLILSKDGSVQECAGAIWADGTAWNLFRGQPEFDGMPKNVREADYISGCWLATRKSTWVIVGGFSDELAPAYCEDMDYCLKVHQIGQQVLVNPHSRVTHLEGQTMGTDVTSKVDGKRYQDINQRKVFAKWRNVLPSLYAPNASLSMQFRGYKHLKPFAIIYDHYCPEPDRDAGSKTVFEFINAICESRAYYPIFVPMNNHYSKYGPQLEKMGVEVIHGSGWDRLERLLSTRGDHVGLTLCSRLSVAKHFQWHIGKSSGKKLIYIHDVEEARHATAWGLSDPKNSASIYQKHVDKWKPIYAMFDHVLTCTETETENLDGKIGVPVETVPPYQEPRNTVAPLPASKCDMIFIGSVNHTPNLAGIEWFVNAVFPVVRSHFPDAILHIAGSGFEACTWLQAPGVNLHGQVSENTLRFLYSQCNISVAPLLEGAGMKGKVVEALSHGRPCLGTDIAYQGMEGLVEQLPAQTRAMMTGTPESLADRIVKYCQSKPLSGLMLQQAIAQSVGKVNPGVALMQIVAGGAKRH